MNASAGFYLRCAALASGLALSLSPAGAQAPPRPDYLLGEVRDSAGKPWVGATVELISAPIPQAIVTEFPPERLTTMTDARGRFRVRGKPYRVYSGWAHGPSGEDPHVHRVTGLVSGIRTKKAVILRQSRHASAMLPFQLTRLDAWKRFGPLRMQVTVPGQNPWRIPVAFDADGRGRLPVVPATRFQVQVFDRRGVALRDRARALPYPPTLGTQVMPLRRAKVYLIGVRAQRSGAPIAGAGIYRMANGERRRVAVTGADGVAELRIPPVFLFSMDSYFVGAEGYGFATLSDTTFSGLGEEKLEKGWKPLRPEVKLHGIGRMVVERKLSGVVRTGGDPVAGMPVVLRDEMRSNWSASFSWLDPVIRVARTDAEGRFMFRGCAGEPSLDLMLRDEDRLRLPASCLRVHERVEAVGRFRKGNSTVAVDLKEFGPLRIQVESMRGQPAEDVACRVVPLSEAEILVGGLADLVPPVRTDRHGEVSLLLPRGEQRILVLQSGSRFAFRSVALAKLEDLKAPLKTPPRLRLRLREPWLLEGVAVGKNGKPIAGATVSCEISGAKPKGSPLEDEKIPGLQVRSVANKLVAPALTYFHKMQKTKTDRQGRFKFSVLACPASYQLQGNKTVFFRQRKSWNEFELSEPRSKPVRIVIQ